MEIGENRVVSDSV